MPKVIAINGPVGVGKTTLLNELKQHFSNCYIIPEYIDALDDAETKLKDYLEGSLSAYEFQEYILDYFESTANQLKNSSYDFIFVERTPVEGIIYFAKSNLNKHEMTQAQYDSLLRHAWSLTFFPNPVLDKSITIHTDNISAAQIAQFIELIQDVKIIKLRASFDVLKKRIQQRGRPYELEHYTDDFLKSMIESYKK